MRVFYDHQVTSLQDAGGASRYHYEILKHLAGMDSVQATALLGGIRSVLPYGGLRSEAVRVRSWRSHLPAGYARYAINEAVSTLLAPVEGRFDVYHASYYRALPAVRRRRLVVTHHDCVQERYPELFRNAASIRRSKRRLFAAADRILCVSAASREDLLRFYDVDVRRTEVIHHGFAPLGGGTGSEEGLCGERSARTGTAYVTGAPYVLYVGARARYKNFGALLAAFAASRSARELRLQVAGGGAWAEEEVRQAAALGISSRVDLVPRASEGELAALYRNAALFVYPSLYEGFGFPPLEAMGEGCPALVSGASSLPEICGDAAFYFDPASREELATTLDLLLSDEALRNSKRAAGFAQVAKYTWPAAAEKTVAAYSRALADAQG